ncbi:PD40 domain-containing protein [Myxococcaceae bacterium JPH2]|nr:PD40 domain-containing protein [Myxococcaceae bacterium JPH2]
MTRRVVVGALCGALWVVAVGCDSKECRDEFDCRDKGAAPTGQTWACNLDNHKCELRNLPAPAQYDAGTNPGDAGETDAGEDSGTPDAGAPDSGTPDAGPVSDGGMTVGKGGACGASDDCKPGLRCEGTPSTCQALYLAVTVSSGGGGQTHAVAVRSDDAQATVVELSESSSEPSRYPRWSKSGASVAFAQGSEGVSSVKLMTRTVSPALGASKEVTDGTTAGTSDFVYMEWEPSRYIGWSQKSGNTISGIKLLPPDGGAPVSASPNGVLLSWAPNGVDYAYSTGADGIVASSIGGAAAPVSGGTGGTEPYYNRTNTELLFLKAKATSPALFNEELYSLPATGGTATLIAAMGSDAVTGGSVDSFIAYPTWSPDGTWAAYVRAYFANPTGGSPLLCGNAGATLCGTREANIIFVRRLDASGAPVGDEKALVPGGTLPAFSPDGRFLAYVAGGKLYVQQLNPADASPVGAAVVHAQPTGIQTAKGDDHRPRWQPR